MVLEAAMPVYLAGAASEMGSCLGLSLPILPSPRSPVSELRPAQGSPCPPLLPPFILPGRSHSMLNSTLTSAPHSTPRLHFLPGFCYCSSLSELGFLSLVAHECPK